MAMSKKIKESIKKIKALVLDVDGTMTEGNLIFDGNGRELKSFNVQDGYGIVVSKRVGLKTAIITAGNSKVVKVRADYLHINKLYSGAYPKIDSYEKMLKFFKVKDEEVCYVGDDLTDCQILKRVGFSVAVKNAVPETKKVADYITKRLGGDGAIREVVELILKTQNKWQKVIAQDL